MSNTDAFAKKMKDEELQVLLDAYRESVASTFTSNTWEFQVPHGIATECINKTLGFLPI